MNNTYVGNLCEAIWLAVERDDVAGQVFNIRDPRAVTKREFIETVCNAVGIAKPSKMVPLPVAKFLAKAMESTWRLLGKKEAPLLDNARIKFLGLNLDYSIDKAIRELGYAGSHRLPRRDAAEHIHADERTARYFFAGSPISASTALSEEPRVAVPQYHRDLRMAAR